jgi:hypothetical protein
MGELLIKDIPSGFPVWNGSNWAKFSVKFYFLAKSLRIWSMYSQALPKVTPTPYEKPIVASAEVLPQTLASAAGISWGEEKKVILANAWEQADDCAKGLLGGCVNETWANILMEKPTAAEMWKTIYDAAQTQIVSDGQCYYTEFYAYRIKATKSMSAQISELQDIQTRANASGLTINNKQFISQIAVILPDSYRLIWGSILRAVGGYEKATIDLIRGEL